MSAQTFEEESFEQAISVKPVSSHTYAANLKTEWCIGTVPHGGYITSIFQNVARTHFAHAHPTLHDSSPDPITIHLTFLRRTEAGPATFTVQDTKLGSRTSTIHITLSQRDPNANVRDEVAGYITLSNLNTESGPSMPSSRNKYILNPPQAPGSNGQRVDLGKLARERKDGSWTPFEVAFSSMRKASKNVDLFVPQDNLEAIQNGFVEQWMRFKPYGKLTNWTNDALGYLIDMFPMMLEVFDERPWDKLNKKGDAYDEAAKKTRFWYPTVLLNVDVKKKLPQEGVEWLYSRVQTKVLKNGRMDLDIVVLDEEGDVVALSNHVALIVSAERNLSKRGGNRNGNAKASKI